MSTMATTLATMAFFGLLRAIRPFTLNHTAKCYTHHTAAAQCSPQVSIVLHEPRPIGEAALLVATRLAVDEYGS